MNLTIKFRDTATPALRNLPALIGSEGALRSGGIGLRDSIIRNFGSLGPNKRFPGASTGFWGRAALSTSAPRVEGQSAVVSITQVGVRQRLLGGTITAQASSNLTIPAQEEAYGKRASEFSDLKVAFLGRSPSGLPIMALVRGNPKISGQKDVMFWLVKSVEQEADPTVLPPEDDMRRAFISGVRSFVNASLGRRAVALEDFS